MSQQILVLGCGPAGAMTAIELKKLDYSVRVISELRDYASIEGVSERVAEALEIRGLDHGLSEPVPRTAVWSGERRAVNFEQLIVRQDFDRSLRNALQQQGVEFEAGRIETVDTNQAEVALKGNRRLQADFIVDARGRAAGYGGGGRIRGPESVSLCANFVSQPGQPMTLAMSRPDGWLWLARLLNGMTFLQKTTGGEPLDLRKEDIAGFLSEELRVIPDINITHTEAGFARSSTPILVEEIISDRYVRIGDAASAVDPLSGNGIFQSLSSALTAVPVVNTILRRPDDGELAMRFYRERVESLFYRFARTGRDFYRSESAFQDETFWRVRQDWPDGELAHPDQDEVLGKAIRPVINHGFVEPHEVVVTRNQPLGIWVNR